MPVHSGANDIVAFVSTDGKNTFASTPFSLVFGKGKVTSPAGKIVKVYVNEAATPVTLTLGSDGYAYFPEQFAQIAATNAAAAEALKKEKEAAAAAAAAAGGKDENNPTETGFRSWLSRKIGGGGGGDKQESSSSSSSSSSSDDDKNTDEPEVTDKNLDAAGIAAEQNKILSGAHDIIKPVTNFAAAAAADDTVKARTPTSEQLAKLNLKPGANPVVFQTHSAIHGNVFVSARIFLLPAAPTTEIVISDIDGTVTKSDVRGHVYTKLGVDWIHPGVAELYNSLVAVPGQGQTAATRLICYLTARNVGQIDGGRNFLAGIKQAGVTTTNRDKEFKLPPGPVFMAAEGLLSALKHELSKQAHISKIATLAAIQAAYQAAGGAGNVLVAGMGNRLGDVRSYTAVGIPPHRNFIINPASVYQFSHQVGKTYSVAATISELQALWEAKK